MKKILLGLIFILIGTLNLGLVSATTFSSELPGGKNYLDRNNFVNDMARLDSIDPIRVKPDTDYVISFPGEREVEQMEIYIEGVDYYLTDRVTMIPNCTPGDSLSYCTFHTFPDESLISISFYGLFMSYYIEAAGMTNFQLEEGLVPTEYEAYIEPTLDNTEPVITGSAAYIKSYQTNESIQTIISNHFTVIDEIDGDITDDLVIVSDEYTGNENTIGEYIVLLEASDSSGNTANFSLTIIVKDEVLPYINGPSDVTVSVDEQLLIDDIITSNYEIGDLYQENYTMDIITDNYTSNNHTLGTYAVDFEVKDQSLNTTSKSILVHVIDDESPILESETSIESNVSNPLYLNDILTSIVYSDNYDETSQLSVEVTDDTLTGNEQNVGNYYIDITISDLSNNVLSTRLLIHVKDDINPIIDGPNNISLSYSKTYDISYFTDLLTVSDNVSVLSKDTITIVNNTYLGNENNVGTYTIDFEVVDGAGNIGVHQITIDVIDDIPPVIYVDNFLVTVASNVTFDENDALLLLLKQNEITDQNYEIKVLKNEYTGSKTVPGNYLFSIELKGEDGTTLQKDFVIEVVEDNKEINGDLLMRNIIVYTLALSILTYTFFKSKK